MIRTRWGLSLPGCAKQEQPGVRSFAAGREDSGFLKNYSKLKAVPDLEGAKGYASAEAQKNRRKYIACGVHRVEVHLASGAGGAEMTETARSAAREYFPAALVRSVSCAYPVVEKPGSPVVRLRAAVVGLDLGSKKTAKKKAAAKHAPFSKLSRGPAAFTNAPGSLLRLTAGDCAGGAPFGRMAVFSAGSEGLLTSGLPPDTALR